jgi:integrase
MFHLAKEDGTLRHLPHFPMLEEASPRKGFVELAQYEKLSRELPDYLRVPLALGFFTAMRLGEVVSLTWSQVDFLHNTITLNAEQTKTGESRVIPICAPLRAVLLEQRAKRKPSCPYVCFKLEKRGVPVKLESFRKAWVSGATRAGLGGLLFHDLRRSGVRNLVRSGVPEKIAMAISGHKTRAVFDRYNIVNGDDLADAGRKLETFFGDKTGTECTEMQQADLPVF